jgi:hypothetical protein
MWGMDLPLLLAAYHLNKNPVPRLAALLLPIILLCWAVTICAVSLLIAWLSGWSLLARRFRASEPWYGESWGWQSARFRGWCGYNNCLNVGANQQSLFLSVMLPFRFFHPTLLIPWQEMEVQTGKMFFGYYDTATFRIGTEERVTVRIYGKLVSRLRQAAGPGWPLYRAELIEAQTRG